MECGRGLDCVKIIKDGETNEFKCTAAGTFEAGETFERAPAQAPSTSGPLGVEFVGRSTVCKTGGEAVVGGTQQCRQLKKNVNDSFNVTGVTETCKTIAFEEPEAVDFDKETAGEETPLCGFNRDSNAFCPVFLGDSPVQTLITSTQKFLDGLKCHRLSGISNFAGGSVCKGMYDVREKKEGFEFFRLEQILDPQEWANTANNEKCVTNTITFRNWYTFGSADLSYGAVGMIATALTYIMM